MESPFAEVAGRCQLSTNQLDSYLRAEIQYLKRRKLIPRRPLVDATTSRELENSTANFRKAQSPVSSNVLNRYKLFHFVIFYIFSRVVILRVRTLRLVQAVPMLMLTTKRRWYCNRCMRNRSSRCAKSNWFANACSRNRRCVCAMSMRPSLTRSLKVYLYLFIRFYYKFIFCKEQHDQYVQFAKEQLDANAAQMGNEISCKWQSGVYLYWNSNFRSFIKRNWYQSGRNAGCVCIAFFFVKYAVSISNSTVFLQMYY